MVVVSFVVTKDHISEEGYFWKPELTVHGNVMSLELLMSEGPYTDEQKKMPMFLMAHINDHFMGIKPFFN